MADERINIIYDLDETGFVSGINKAASANNKMNTSLTKTTRRSGAANNAIINIARGANDAKFGFQGLANNLEFMVESIGQVQAKSGSLKETMSILGRSLLGPTGVVAAISIMIGYGPQIIGFFSSFIGASNEAAAALAKFEKGIAKLNETIAEQRLRLEKASLDTYIENLEKARKRAKSLAQQNIIDPTSAATIADLLGKIESGYQSVANAQQAVDDEGFGKTSKETYSGILDDLRHSEALLKAQGIGEEEILTWKIEQLKAITAQQVGQKAYLATLKDIELAEARVATIQANPAKGKKAKPIGVGYSHGFLTKGQNGPMLSEAEETGKKLGQALQTGMQSSLIGLGQAIGDTIAGDGSFGDKFLGVLGGFLKAFGSAIIAVGVAKLKLDLALTTPGAAPLAIAAGVALVAAGAALSSLGAKGVGGGGSGSAASASTSTSTPLSLQSTQSSTQTIKVVGEIDGQVIRLNQQRAQDSYDGLS